MHNMRNLISLRNKGRGRSLLLLGVYLLHFALFQSVVAGFPASNLFRVKSFFSDSHKSQTPNSGIAVFRTLEKHEVAQQTFKLSPDIPVLFPTLFDIVPQSDEPHGLAAIPLLHFADSSYRLYVRDCVFRV